MCISVPPEITIEPAEEIVIKSGESVSIQCNIVSGECNSKIMEIVTKGPDSVVKELQFGIVLSC